MKIKWKCDKPGWIEAAAVGAGFLVSRAAFWLAGVRFDATTLDWFWQFAEPALLRERLAESLWFMHMQPPVFNGVIGLVTKAAPGGEGAVIAALFLILGLLMAVAINAAMREAGVMQLIRGALMVFWMLNPSVVIYERWLFYTHPVTVMLALAGWCFVMALSRRSMAWAAGYLILLAVIALTRSVFHLVWVGAFAALLVLAWRDDPAGRRRLAVMAGLALVPVVGLFVKNAVMFDRFASSSWFGMSLMKITWAPLSLEERRELAMQGDFPESAQYEPFWDLDYYVAWIEVEPETGVAILDRRRKASGWPNYNHMAYLQVDREGRRNGLGFIRRWPGRYLEHVGRAALIYARPAHDVFHILPNRDPIAGWARAWDFLFAGRFYYPREVHDPNRLDLHSAWQRWLTQPWFHLLGLPALIGFGLWLGLRHWRRGRVGPGEWLALWCAALMIYISMMSILFELGENNRFRFMTLPASYCLLGCFAQWAFTCVRWRSNTAKFHSRNPRR